MVCFLITPVSGALRTTSHPSPDRHQDSIRRARYSSRAGDRPGTGGVESSAGVDSSAAADVC